MLFIQRGTTGSGLSAEFLELVCHELHLRSYDDLDRVLGRAENAFYASALDFLLIDKEPVLDLEAETCDAVIDSCDI